MPIKKNKAWQPYHLQEVYHLCTKMWGEKKHCWQLKVTPSHWRLGWCKLQFPVRAISPWQEASLPRWDLRAGSLGVLTASGKGHSLASSHLLVGVSHPDGSKPCFLSQMLLLCSFYLYSGFCPDSGKDWQKLQKSWADSNLQGESPGVLLGLQDNCVPVQCSAWQVTLQTSQWPSVSSNCLGAGKLGPPSHNTQEMRVTQGRIPGLLSA